MLPSVNGKPYYLLRDVFGSYVYSFLDQMESIPCSLRPGNPAVAALASEGVQVHEKIRDWHVDASSRLNLTDPYAQLTIATFHALELFHCRNFTFYSCWESTVVPCLTPHELDAHVASTLHLSQKVLDASVIPGVTLLFPLRIAGANATCSEQRARIVDILGQIHKTGFIVSERIEADVQEIWNFMAAQDSLV